MHVGTWEFETANKFNNNIGCIEIVLKKTKAPAILMFNNNIGCIEIGNGTLIRILKMSFNNNIGCIEINMQVRDSPI